MTNENNEIKFALDFPQGHMLFMKSHYKADEAGDIYFKPRTGAAAFKVAGKQQELFGKRAISVVRDEGTGAGAYSLVYEFGRKGALTDARLVTKAETVDGTLTDKKFVRSLNKALAEGLLALHDREEPNEVFNAARFPDGRLLIQLFNKNELYLGAPGNYTKLDAHLLAQGGNSMIYELGDKRIELPYGYGGPGAHDIPTFAGEELSYVKVKSGDPAAFGLDLPRGIVHLGPFSLQLKVPEQQTRLQKKFRP